MKKIKRFLSRKYTLTACKVIIGFIFIIAGAGKIIDPHGFARDVYSYALLPDMFVPAFAAIVPWIEFIAGALLILDVKPQSNALIINGLLVMFLAAIVIDLARGGGSRYHADVSIFFFPKRKLGGGRLSGIY